MNDQQAAWKKAISTHNRRQRTGRARRKPDLTPRGYRLSAPRRCFDCGHLEGACPCPHDCDYGDQQ